MIKLAYIALGGSIGAILRFLIGAQVQSGQSVFPYGTLAVNLAGCLCIGLAYSLIPSENEMMKLLIIVGILGGFTTFSSFSLDFFKLIDQGSYNLAGIYIVLSNVVGIALVILGIKLGDLI